MYRKLLKLTYEVENIKVLSAIRKGFISMLPLLLVGALALVLKSFPVMAVQEFLKTAAGGMIYLFLDNIYNITYGLLSLYLTVSISFYYAQEFAGGRTFLTILNMVLAMMSVLACLGYGREDFNWSVLGAVGVFTAIVISLLSTALFFCLYRIFCKKIYHREDRSEEVDYVHLYSMMIPFFGCLFLFLLLNFLLCKIAHVSSLNALFASFFGYIFKFIGNHIGAGILVVLFESLLWFFGIHGGNTLEQVQQNLFVPANTDAGRIVSKTFIDTFGLMGGCGTAICLLLALMLFARQKKNRNLMKAAIFPIVFNVNEPLVFGLPIVFNPLLFIPFVLVPVVSILIAYLATIWGFIPVTTRTVVWTTPILLSGYVATGSLAGAVVQFVEIVVGTILYAPFIRLMEHAHEKGETIFVEEMEKEIQRSLEENKTVQFLNQHNALSRAATALLYHLKKDISDGRITMFYQSQMTAEETVYGAEALLRWEYAGKRVYPPLVTCLAKEGQMMDELTLAILKQVCQDMQTMFQQLGRLVKVSVNITADQLNDTSFVKKTIAIAEQYHVAEKLCMEVTEETSIAFMEYISQNIELFSRHRITVSIDDFSMGHTSLKYLQENQFSYVKLDGELVCKMLDNMRCQEIISSIIALGKNLDFHVVAEYVDSEAKKEKLLELGCDYLQGYLYSAAIPVDEFLEFCRKKS